jgi:hypothetical protein
MSEPHPRWARATEDQANRIKEVLLRIIESTGRPLEGGVTAHLVKGMSTYDLLDLAQGQLDRGRAPGVKPYLDSARTLLPEE